jgi:hypothetical protein
MSNAPALLLINENHGYINSDPVAMRFFPVLIDRAQSEIVMDNFSRELAEKGFTYFAVDCLADNEFIGFIGLYISIKLGETRCQFKRGITGYFR